MKSLFFILLALVLSCPALAAPPYENPPESKAGPGVEEIWTDQGVRYYRGLPGTPSTSRPKTSSVQPYQPEIEFGAPAPLTATKAKKTVRKAPKAQSVRKAPARKKTTARRRVRRSAPKVAQVRKAAPAAPATGMHDAEPDITYGADPFSAGGIAGTTRLQ